MKNKYKKEIGFSLLELMIILAITALMVQIAIPNYKIHVDRAKALEAEVESFEETVVSHVGSS